MIGGESSFAICPLKVTKIGSGFHQLFQEGSYIRSRFRDSTYGNKVQD